jgi:hypothetical protein
MHPLTGGRDQDVGKLLEKESLIITTVYQLTEGVGVSVTVYMCVNASNIESMNILASSHPL